MFCVSCEEIDLKVDDVLDVESSAVFCPQCKDEGYDDADPGQIALALVVGGSVLDYSEEQSNLPTGTVFRTRSYRHYLVVEADQIDEVYTRAARQYAESLVDDYVSEPWIKDFVDLDGLAGYVSDAINLVEEGDCIVDGTRYTIIDLDSSSSIY